jgi:RNA polymerase primary sigma factor
MPTTLKHRAERTRTTATPRPRTKKLRPQPEPPQAQPNSLAARRHRAQAIKELTIDFITHRSFSRPGIEEQILAECPSNGREERNNELRDVAKVPMYIARLYDTSLLTAEQERHLFRQFNFLRYRARRQQRKLAVAAPNRTLMQSIQDDLTHANAVKARIIQANLRLVVSIAKKFVNPANSLEELISDGNIALIRAVEKFNFGLGNRFSTYATYAVQRNYFRMVSRGRRQRERFLSDEERLSIIPQAEHDQPVGAAGLQQLQQSFGSLLQKLNSRERQILERRFGFHGQEPKTFKELGADLGVCKERIRQIQTRAMEKLRQFAETENLLSSYDDHLELLSQTR